MKSQATPFASSTCVPTRRWRVGGRVQGVGFRPFVYRIATTTGLRGSVRNCGGYVEIHAQGTPHQLDAFGTRLLAESPPASRPVFLDVAEVTAEASADFSILPSTADALSSIHVPPDQFSCADCLDELRDPHARRFGYPFINCTQCGPRYTLILAMPYDRPNTTMASFAMCPDCDAEYRNPLDRRFHAQPLACPRCGPQLSWEAGAEPVHDTPQALAEALRLLRSGGIVAARGIGGYHLLCDAANEEAVALLRARKHRPAKPLALMVPSRGSDGLDDVRAIAHVSAPQAEALTAAKRPIVLLKRRAGSCLATSIAPGLADIGVMLPYSPLHHLLLDAFDGPLVATSGNISGEPVLTEVEEARRRLTDIADGFLHHNRPIARPADDSVERMIQGKVRPLRLGRGLAPLELTLPQAVQRPLLAVGAYMKNTVALAFENRVVISPHIGDLDSPRSRDVFARVVEDLQSLYAVRAQAIACDAHADFPNTRWAKRSGLPVHAVWHHHAHASALAGEFAVNENMLCFTWDGVGLGADDSLWGGEALLGRPGRWKRVASFRPFRLPGGDRAAREPWRSALSLCWEIGEEWQEMRRFADPRLRVAFDRGLNSPMTSAVGRLFDAAAALAGVCTQASFEGEAPMRLEALVEEPFAGIALPLHRDEAGVLRSDWAPLVAAMRDQCRAISQRAAMFHATLAGVIVDQAVAIRAANDLTRVGLCGGVFQNRVLAELAVEGLTSAGFEVLLPEVLPVNDAAISFGQVVEAAAFDSPLTRAQDI